MNRNFKIFLFFLILSLTALSQGGCIARPETSELDRAIAEFENRVGLAKQEMKQFPDNSPLRALTLLRKEIYEQTLAMLHQRKAALISFTSLSYSVDGSVFSPPSDRDAQISATRAKIDIVKSSITQAKAKAEVSRGLGQSLNLMQAQVESLKLAQLEYHVTALENAFPSYMPDTVPPAPGRATLSLNESAAGSVFTDNADSANLELKEMLETISVRLLEKSFLPQDFQKEQYEDQVNFKFEYENQKEKAIRAFTGTVIFKDIFDREFRRVSLTVDKPLLGKSKIIDDGKGMAINRFNEDARRLATTETENLRIGFEPESIIFDDGTRLGKVGAN